MLNKSSPLFHTLPIATCQHHPQGHNPYKKKKKKTIEPPLQSQQNTKTHHHPQSKPPRTTQKTHIKPINLEKSTKLPDTTAKHSKIHTHHRFTSTIATRTHIKTPKSIFETNPKTWNKNIFFLKPSTQKSLILKPKQI